MDSKVYVEYNGKRYTFCLLVIYDDFSRYVIWWKLFLKEAKADGSGTKGVTTRVWTTAVATAMYRTTTRPAKFYYDNGTYYIAADDSLQQMNEDDEPETNTSKSKPGRPEGRGKIENFFKQLVAMLNRMAGRYNEREGVADARREADPYSFDEAEKEFDKKMNEWNNAPHRKDGRDTRFEVWSKEMGYNAPPIRRLAQLRDIEFEYDKITFKQDYNWALQFKGSEWEPLPVSAEVSILWARAVAARATLPYWAVKLDTGWVAEVCLDEQAETWVEIVQKGSQPHDRELHNETMNASLKDLELRRKAIEQASMEVLIRLGGVPVAAVSSGEYIDVLPDGKLPKPEDAPQLPATPVDEEPETEAEKGDGATEGGSSPGYAAMYERLKARLREKE